MSFFRLTDVLLIPRTTASGIGQVSWLFPGTSVNIQSNPNAVTARRRNRDGILATASQEVGEETYTVTLTTEVMDWYTLQLLNNQYAEDSSNAEILVPQYTNVPSSAPFEIVDAAITSGNQSKVTVQIAERGTWGETGYRKVVTSSPSAGEVQYSSGSTKLVFHSSDAGAPIVWLKPISYTLIETLGKEAVYKAIGGMKMYFRELSDDFYPTGLWYYLPKLTRSRSVPSTDFGQTPVQNTLEFGALAQANNPLPYQILNLNTAVT